MTEAGRHERLDATDRWLAEFRAFTDLSPDDAIDRDLLIGELEAARFADTDLREEAWDPLWWVYLAGDGFFPLLAREFAPLADRLASAAGRMETLPEVLEAAEASLVGHAGRPVGRFQTETALKQLAGIGELVDDAPRRPPTTPRHRRGCRGAGAPPDGRGRDRPRGDRPLRGPSARRGPARERGRGPPRPRALRGQDAPHDALRGAHPRPDPRRRRARVRRGPRRDGPARA